MRRRLDAGAPRVVATWRTGTRRGCAFWHALGLFFRGDLAPAMGWVARGGRVLEESGRDCIEQVWLRMLKALPLLFQGDADAAYPSFVEAGEIAVRFADPDATMFARLCRGLRADPAGTDRRGHGAA